MSSPVQPSRSTRLDPYVDQYAERTSSMTVSAVRALFAVANRPEVVSLAGGMPNIADLPLDVIGQNLAELVSKQGTKAMQYGSGQGEEMLREQICDVLCSGTKKPCNPCLLSTRRSRTRGARGARVAADGAAG